MKRRGQAGRRRGWRRLFGGAHSRSRRQAALSSRIAVTRRCLHAAGMLSGKLLRVLALVCAAVVGIGLCGATWPIEIDGKKADAPWYALSDSPEKLAVGDALYVGNENGGLWLCVRDTENLCFVNRLQSEALLYRKVGEKLEVVGFGPSNWLEDEAVRLAGLPPETDLPRPTLSGLSEPVVAGLWGLKTRLSPGETGSFAQVRPEMTFCEFDLSSGGERLSKAAYRAVSLNWPSPVSDEIYRILSPSLRFLRLHIYNSPERKFDARRLGGAPGLRVLECRATAVDRIEEIGALSELRRLRLAWSKGLERFEWAVKLHRLEEVDLSYSDVRDLSSLAGLPRLAQVDVSPSALDCLPAQGFSALRRLDAIGTKLESAKVAAFRASHPGCRLRFEWKQALMDELKEVDRLVVRSGGTCHRNPAEEKVLFETRASSDVAEFLDLIEIDEKESTGACMCCGSPTLEFYAGERHLAMVGIQHGFALRWGDWPADGKLTQKSAWALTEWLARRGVNEPYDELHREEVAAKARERSQIAFGEATEPELRAELEKAQPETVEDFLAAITKAYPVSEARVIAILRLVGAETEASWNLGDPRGDPLCEQGLAKLDAAELGRALVVASRSADARVVAGAARFYFRKKNWEQLEAKTQEAFLPALVAWAARSPREIVRSRLVRALELIGSEPARAELRRIAAENPAARTLEPKQAPEGGQWKEFGPTDGDVPEGTPVALHAVLALARLGDPQAAELLGTANALARAEDAAVVARIEAILKDPKLADEDRTTSGAATLVRKP